MNNWSDITDIFKWFPLEINSFAKSYGYEYTGANYTKYKYLDFDGPEKCVRLYTAKNASHLGYVIVVKEINRNNPLIANAYVTIELDLPSSLKPEQFFPFIDEQLNKLLESIEP
jgi:hypothetical protein